MHLGLWILVPGFGVRVSGCGFAVSTRDLQLQTFRPNVGIVYRFRAPGLCALL